YWCRRQSGSVARGPQAGRIVYLSACQTDPSVEVWAAFSLRLMAYAIIKTGGRQFRVAEGDTIDVDLLDVDSGKTATFGEVLMFADGKDVTHGNTLISGAKVTAEVVEQRKGNNVIAINDKLRTSYHRSI